MSLAQLTAVSDGDLPHGSFDITMLETGTVFIADNFKWDPTTKKLESMDSRGRVNRRKILPVGISGSCDFQLADKDTLAPQSRETFAVDADKDGNIEPYQVEKFGRTFESGDIFKASGSIDAMVNPLIYDSVTLLAPAVPALTHAVAMAATNALAAFLPRDVVLAATPWTASGLPAGVTMAAATGILSGTPTTAGSYYVTYKVAGTLTLEDGTVKTRVGIRKFLWTVA